MVLAGNNRDGIAHSLALLGFLAETRGDLNEATAQHLRALAYARETRESRALALALEGLAGVAATDGDGTTAGRLLGAASALRSSVTWRTGWPVASVEQSQDPARIRELAVDLIGPDAFSGAFDVGAADPAAVLAAVPRLDIVG